MQRTPPATSPDDRPKPAASILLVDDTPANLVALEAVLGGLGHHLVKATSGEEALRLLLDRDFAVVLLDVRMPGLDGFATAKLIRGRERSRHTPIIFVTAYDDHRLSVEQAYALGAVDYLVKPLVPAVLRAKVAGLVDLFSEKEAARRQAGQFRLLVQETVDYAIFMLDPEGRIATWNAGAERIKGYRANEIIGQHFSRFYPQEAIDRGWPAEELRRATADGRFEDEGWRLRKDGTRFWANVVITALRDEAGRLRGFSKVTRDLTERRKREEALRQLHRDLERRVEERTAALEAANAALRAAARQKDEFLAMLAHELRNPLAPIRHAVQIVQMPDAGRRALERAGGVIGRQVNHLSRLVDDLLDVSRITRGKVTLRKERVDLAPVVAQAVETSRPLIEARGHELTVELPRQPVCVEGDATRLAQVLANLLNNSAKYTPDGGHLGLTVEAGPGEAVVRVRDDGVGITAELLPQVFDLFTQGGRSLARSEGGLGIGLAMVKSLVEMHGGSVVGRSDGPGRGSEFVVRLPTVPPSPSEAADDGGSGHSSPPSSPPRRVLIVDDNADAADILAMLLRVGGHDVRTAHDGPAALETAAAFRPEVVLLDIGLPLMDGYQVARRLREQDGAKQALVVALTGYGQEEDRRRAEEAGFDAHLVKPTDPAALQRLVASLEAPP
jgi:PAS domain S-box-containing protein